MLSPEAAEGGNIALIEAGDTIVIDIPQRIIRIEIDDATLERRRATQQAKGWKPALPRKRQVSTALKAYAALTTSADKGAVRNRQLLDA